MPTAGQEALSTPVQFLKGVGPRRAQLLRHIGIGTLEQLLLHLPREWEDRRETTDLSHPAGKIALRGTVLEVEAAPFLGRSGLSKFRARLQTAAGTLDALWFKRWSPRYDVLAPLTAELKPGAKVWVVGRPEQTLLRVHEIHVDEHYPAEGPGSERAFLHVDRLTPVHPLTQGLSARFMRDIVYQALERADGVAEVLPPALLKRRGLPPVAQALRALHFPASAQDRDRARMRLAYDEFLLLELALAVKRRQLQKGLKDFRYTLKRNLLTPFRRGLGFEFTRAQKRVIDEIVADMQGPHPMNRLLQGDVGSGKTVVAASALLLAVENGHQGSLMAPTEILAEQHYLTFLKLFRGLGVRVELLTSKVKGKARARILEDLAAGRVNIAIGTHALLDDEVRFGSLALAVIDEQHRFGVRQRTVLRLKGLQPDLLVMTATPIPRTLALTLYGDLDVSTLDELPPGRRPVETLHLPEAAAFEALAKQVRLGHQGFVVYPVIEESSKVELKAAVLEAGRLARDVFPGLRVGLLHGQLSSAKKDEVMEAFARGDYQILVTTPVVEVGVDVPNATVMVVQHAERFGLSSLHQLRGRVGRSSLPSWCFLVGDPATQTAQDRIATLCRTHDGFEISEMDLKLRGPGEMLGVEQHGPLSLKVGDLTTDLGLIRQAREDGERLLAEDPSLLKPEHRPLRERLVEQYQRRWRWIDLS